MYKISIENYKLVILTTLVVLVLKKTVIRITYVPKNCANVNFTKYRAMYTKHS